MKVGDFAIWNKQVVAIQESTIFDGTTIISVKRILNKLDKSESEAFPVWLEDLVPFNQKTAQELLDLHNKEISKHNVEKHIINDCLLYI